MRNLYLRIYLTVVVALLAFALAAGWLVRQHMGSERHRFEAVVNDRTTALGELLANSLPDAAAPPAEQASAVQAWSRRMRVPLALDDRAGERVAASPSFERRALRGPDAGDALVRIPLGDGRVLWLGRPSMRHGEMGPRPPLAGAGFGAPPEAGAPPDSDAVGVRTPPGPVAWLRAPGWLDEIGVLASLLAVLYLAVAAGAYPVVRRLTRRLEALKQGVQAFGDGDLARQVQVDGSDEVAAVAASFNQAARRIDELVRANRSLLANASHELRSPLARLKMAVEMMEGAEPPRRAALKAEIGRDIAELDALVEEVLLASRLGARHELPVVSVDLLGLLAEEATRVDAAFDGVPLQVQGDERLLRRALRNLLENAQRYGGGAVDATLARGLGDTVELRVCDRGPGVPAAFHERVFEPFFRLPGHAERAGGVGLGLALVRQIAQRHGGTVRCEAREGGGSCFVLALPAGQAPPVPVGGASAVSGPAGAAGQVGRGTRSA